MWQHLPCSISHQSLCNILIIASISRPPHHQPRSPTQHKHLKHTWDLKLERLIELWCSGLQSCISCISDIQKHDFMQRGCWVICPLWTCPSNVHLVSSLFCFHSMPHTYIPAFLCLYLSLKTRESEQLTSLSGAFSTQAENMIAGRPAKHEMSGGSRLLNNPLIFKLDWLVVEYGCCSEINTNKNSFLTPCKS